MIPLDVINGEIASLETKEPTYVIMEKLAWLYIVRDHITLPIESPQEQNVVVTSGIITTDGDSEFMVAIKGKSVDEVLHIVDELMQTVQVLQPKLYDAVLRKLE